jgi:nitroimidazol reductase NimA-like FMN-containing flavoprotein (pyridoxamine 5'-phosphate oxidase superfamily)
VVVDAAGLEVLAREECVALMEKAVIGRIVFTSGALPAVQPVNFVLDHDNSVIIRTGEGSKLSAAARDAVVAFEVDDFDVDERIGWSVIVTGRARVVRDPEERARLADSDLQPWVPSRRDHFIRIEPEFVSGRRITRGAPTPV